MDNNAANTRNGGNGRNGQIRITYYPSCATPGTYTIGATGTYTSITSVTNAFRNCTLTGSYIFEFQASYISTAVETFPINFTAFAGSSTTNTLTFRPAAGLTSFITSSNAVGTINLNGATNIIFDGRSAGLGTTKNLNIYNTNNAGAAVIFSNGAANNAIKYCTIKGQNNNATNGVVLFSTSTGAAGNNSNTIDNSEISSTSTTVSATNGIYSAGTAGKLNMLNTISNSNIIDIFNSGAKSVGILMEANTSEWTINANSIYQTPTRTSSSTLEAIEINNKTNGSGHTISNNFIGGLFIGATGTGVMTFTGSGYFAGISIYGAIGAANVVSGNTVRNFTITCNARNIHSGIYHSDGTANITNNIIGDSTTTNSIQFNSSAPTVSFVSPAFTGICGGGGYTPGTVGGNVNIQNNVVGSIQSNATGGTGANEVRAIFYQGSNSLVDISNNFIGGNLTNSIYNSGNGATVGIVINSGFTTTAHTVKNNLVRNFASFNKIGRAHV